MQASPQAAPARWARRTTRAERSHVRVPAVLRVSAPPCGAHGTHLTVSPTSGTSAPPCGAHGTPVAAGPTYGSWTTATRSPRKAVTPGERFSVCMWPTRPRWSPGHELAVGWSLRRLRGGRGWDRAACRCCRPGGRAHPRTLLATPTGSHRSGRDPRRVRGTTGRLGATVHSLGPGEMSPGIARVRRRRRLGCGLPRRSRRPVNGIRRLRRSHRHWCSGQLGLRGTDSRPCEEKCAHGDGRERPGHVGPADTLAEGSCGRWLRRHVRRSPGPPEIRPSSAILRRRPQGRYFTSWHLFTTSP